MATVAEDIYKFPDANAMRDCVEASAEFVITGGAGAIGTTDADDVGITLARTGAGTYNGTFPACPAGSTAGIQGRARIIPYVAFSPALTVVDAVITARSVTAGTFTVKTLNAAGAATDGAAADIIGVKLILQYRPVP